MVFHPSHRPLEIATRFPQFHSPDDDDISPTNKKHKGTLLSSYRGGHFYWALTASMNSRTPNGGAGHGRLNGDAPDTYGQPYRRVLPTDVDGNVRKSAKATTVTRALFLSGDGRRPRNDWVG